jgi:hypothetical protein
MKNQGVEFNCFSKKLVVLYIMLGYVYQSHSKARAAMYCLRKAEEIVKRLDHQSPKNVDLILAYNIITAFILLKLGKPKQSVSSLTKAQEMATRLFDEQVIKPLGYEGLDKLELDQ